MSLKIGLLLLALSCSILKTKNLASVQLGMSENQFLADYKAIQIKQFRDYKLITIGDGLVVSNGTSILEKFPLQHEWTFNAQVGSISTVEGQKFKYFIAPDTRTIDSGSILFPQAVKQVKTLMRFYGEEVVDSEAEATAILKIGYAVTGYQKRSFTQGMIVLSESTEYTRVFSMTAIKKEKGSTNLWELKVDSIGTSNAMDVFLPGLITASGPFINKNTSGSQTVDVEATSIAMNIVKSPEVFEKYTQK